MAGLVMFGLLRRRYDISHRLKTSNSDLPVQTCLRLLVMCVVQTSLWVCVIAFSLWDASAQGLLPWKGVHIDWSYIGQYTVVSLPPGSLQRKLFCWWAVPASSLVTFGSLSFGGECKSEYIRLFGWVCKVMSKERTQEAIMLRTMSVSKRCVFSLLHIGHLTEAAE
ncbi:hypothetical protein PHLCEN_2v3337 [Hermanssonia centrifuga]|uniref:Uncharacterized protein n=1 Tax=Hermanssonia centrifuga TaxID=98765 RepID=A0A2R6QM94_9APHY|nr:hypothetical protein PHLCEN_2v3337 [Hermanssonia centrifuga]